MITLKESLLGSTKSKVGKMSETVKKAQLDGMGFPDFEDEFDGWIWQCPEILERNESNIYKLTKRKKTYCGFWVEIIQWRTDETGRDIYDKFTITIDAITDHTGNMPWMGSNELIRFTCDRDMKKVYELFQLFGLNVDEMIEDFIKLGKDYVVDDVYDMIMKKYGK